MDRLRNGNIKKWYSILEIVDTETGELINKEKIKKKNI